MQEIVCFLVWDIVMKVEIKIISIYYWDNLSYIVIFVYPPWTKEKPGYFLQFKICFIITMTQMNRYKEIYASEMLKNQNNSLKNFTNQILFVFLLKWFFFNEILMLFPFFDILIGFPGCFCVFFNPLIIYAILLKVFSFLCFGETSLEVCLL